MHGALGPWEEIREEEKEEGSGEAVCGEKKILEDPLRLTLVERKVTLWRRQQIHEWPVSLDPSIFLSSKDASSLGMKVLPWDLTQL